VTIENLLFVTSNSFVFMKGVFANIWSFGLAKSYQSFEHDIGRKV
jgi:hypothetical protein